MAYSAITAGQVDVGDPVTKDLMDKIKDNFIDHESRIASVEGSSSGGPIFDSLIVNSQQWGGSSTLTGISYYRAGNSGTLSAAIINQIDASTSGTLEIDVLKSTTGIDGTYTTVFNTKPSIASNGSDLTVVDYTLLTGDTVTVTINGTPTVLTEGVDWTAATSNNATASSLQGAITALTGVTASVNTNVVSVNADNTYQATIATSDGTNLTISQANIAGDNTASTNADIGTTSFAAGDWLRIDITSFQSSQKRFHFYLK